MRKLTIKTEMQGFAEYLYEQGYAASTIQQYVYDAKQYSVGAASKHYKRFQQLERAKKGKKTYKVVVRVVQDYTLELEAESLEQATISCKLGCRGAAQENGSELVSVESVYAREL